MQKEYDLFLEKIKSEQSVKPNQAIESAYEIVYKQDILYCFEDDDLNLSYKEKKHLLSKKRNTCCQRKDRLNFFIKSGFQLIALICK